MKGNITENAKIGFEEINIIREETDDAVTYQFPMEYNMHTLDESTLEILDIWTNRIPAEESYSGEEIKVVGIDWSCNLGWGRYELCFEENGTRIVASSEHMDNNNDKAFLKALLNKIYEATEVID